MTDRAPRPPERPLPGAGHPAGGLGWPGPPSPAGRQGWPADATDVPTSEDEAARSGAA